MGGEPRPRQREDGTPKLAPDGRPTFSTGVVVARSDGGQDRGITVAVVEPQEYPLGTRLCPDGRAWVTPSVTDARRLGLSVIVERLVPGADGAPAGAGSDRRKVAIGEGER